MKLVKPKPKPVTEPKREPITPFIKGTVRMPSWDLLTADIRKVQDKGFKS